MKINTGISINDVESVIDPVSGRLTFKYELTSGITVEASSIKELVTKINNHFQTEEVDHGQAD